MNSDIIREYRKQRRENPYMSAATALIIAKAPDDKGDWEAEGSDRCWKREVDGFTVKLTVEDESIFPVPDKHGNTDYGSYVDTYNRDYDYEWDGQWEQPRVLPPLGIPYTSIHYDGPGWMQGERGGYFIPDGIEEQFAYYRSAGASKSVAWEMTRRFVEEQVTMLFHSPLINCVVVITAYKNDIELASTAMGTDVSGDDYDYVFTMAREYGMVSEVIEDAKQSITKLTA